ncbi:MAG: alpha/beta fold hydrolase [Phycisphaerales bacterium]|nr:alpha/beta fold hydrolase [Phycisphaerales bacterium]
MHPRFARFPKALADQARHARLGAAGVPALLAHPDWARPAPTLVWLHGRTVSKELDPGRYLRLIRAGIAVCAIDLPGHGERDGPRMHDPRHTLDVVEQAVGEIDAVVRALRAVEDGGVFDPARFAIGGMSAGGMITLRRLCEPHPFSAAFVEATSGRLTDLYFPPAGSGRKAWPIDHPRERVERLDPSRHLAGWRPIPFLAIHATTDRVVAFETQRAFIDDLRAHYAARGSDPEQVRLVTFTETGAPEEHAGFGRHSNDAKIAMVEFLTTALGTTPG